MNSQMGISWLPKAKGNYLFLWNDGDFVFSALYMYFIDPKPKEQHKPTFQSFWTICTSCVEWLYQSSVVQGRVHVSWTREVMDLPSPILSARRLRLNYFLWSVSIILHPMLLCTTQEQHIPSASQLQPISFPVSDSAVTLCLFCGSVDLWICFPSFSPYWDYHDFD